MSRLAHGAEGATMAARGIAVGILSNTIFKAGVAGVIGAKGYRLRVLGGLALLSAVLGVMLLF
jgi:hypothetical protein